MIAKLTGIVDSLGEDWAVIDVQGVGYLVQCSGRALARLAVGEAARLFVETRFREDRIQLIGFADAAERDWFRLLTAVQGVGARVALAILSTLTVDELMTAIAAGDRTAVSRAPGVGGKLAGRVVSELKDRVGGLALGAVAGGPVSDGAAPGGGAASDAVSALVNLGYGASEALRAVSAAAGRLGPEARLEDLIRAGLAELAPREHAS